MLYTVIPLEVVLGSEERRPPQAWHRLPGGEGWVLAEQDPEGTWRVARVLATDPRVFLTPSLQPGTEVRLMPHLYGDR